jgi:hypothetical protein
MDTKIKYTPDNITSIDDDQIFVFGSNCAGKHDGGAARYAHTMLNAEYGVGEGITGKCYAFPTLDENFCKRSLDELVKSRDLLYKTCLENKDKTFLLTKVGCGIAGYSSEFMKNLFIDNPKNLIKPIEWHKQTLWFKIKNKSYNFFFFFSKY